MWSNSQRSQSGTSSIKFFGQVCERNLIVRWKCKDCLDTFRDNCRKIHGNLSFTQSHTVTRLEDVVHVRTISGKSNTFYSLLLYFFSIAFIKFVRRRFMSYWHRFLLSMTSFSNSPDWTLANVELVFSKDVIVLSTFLNNLSQCSWILLITCFFFVRFVKEI
jgi:hypothetical protein